MNIGIIGNGVVGNAIYQNLKDKVKNIFIYDINPDKSRCSYQAAINSDIIFVCLPTPMLNKTGGACDLSYINDFFNQLPKDLKGLFVIKSTVPIGTTQNLANKRNELRIIHNPEFLTERNAIADFKNLHQYIIGGALQHALILKNFYVNYFEDCECILVTSDESEAIKYFRNSYLGLKVAYFNLIYDACEKLGMNFDTVRRCVVLDQRIGESHSFVPGVDGDRGFGGTCFPKDLNALLCFFQAHDLNSSLLLSVWEYNMSIRKLVNW
jgi:UDPglucose 6-dehydrogenase